MSTGAPQSPAVSTSAAAPPAPKHRGWTLATAAAAAMVVLALIGIGLTISNSQNSETYWIILVPVYGTLCVVTAWYRQHSNRTAALRQVLHWAGIAAAIGIDFTYIRRTGLQTSAATGLTSLLLLSLGCYLAGVHMEWHFAVAGVLLTATLIVVAVADQYLPLMLGVGVIILVLMLLANWYLHRRAKSAVSKPKS